MALIVLFVMSLALAGCASSAFGPVKQTVPYDDDAFAPYEHPGLGTITGSAFLKTRGGDVKLGAGNKVELIPATPYTVERFTITARGAQPEPRDLRLVKHVRTTLADARGEFEFRELPPGDYFLVCTIEWEVAGSSILSKTGAQAIARTTVHDGEIARVVLTR